MTKIDRTRLARGTKLLTDHVHVPLSSIASQINTGNVDAVQTQQRHGTFRINLNFAALGAEGPFYDQNPWSVPFCLPPLQEYWGVTSRGGLNQWNTDQGTPLVFLDEVSIGFDQRDAPAAIVSEGDFSGAPGLNTAMNECDYATLQAYDFTVSLVEKSQVFFGGTDELYRADRTIFSIPLEEVLFSGLERRENPLLINNINQVYIHLDDNQPEVQDRSGEPRSLRCGIWEDSAKLPHKRLVSNQALKNSHRAGNLHHNPSGRGNHHCR